MSTPPDDRTLLVSAGRHAGAAAPSPAQPDHALPPATEVGGFEIESVLGAGGFGIVYLAYDRMLQRHVALKEYMPAAFALRSGDGRVHPRSERDAEAFRIGLRSFVNEARLLAQFDAPSLLRVYRFWEAQGTAYMVMPYYRGPTLKQALAQATAPMDEAALRRLLDDILDALDLLHAQHCYHRDIAPDNILMADGRQPVLLDFGAARSAIGDMTQAFTAIFKQAYAPVEQIGGDGDLRQGPWTDLFALAGVLHFAIDGRPPPPSIGRLLSDNYVPLAQRYAGRYGHAFLAAIDAALAVRPQDRPQSVAQMRRLLDAGAAVNVSGTGAAPVQALPDSPPAEAPRSAAAPKEASQAAPREAPQDGQPPGAPAQRRAGSWPAPRLIAALAVVATGIGIGGYFVAGRAAPEAAKPAARQAAMQAAPAGPVQPALPAPLAQLLAGADAAHAVAAMVGRPRVVIGHDRFGLLGARRLPVRLHARQRPEWRADAVSEPGRHRQPHRRGPDAAPAAPRVGDGGRRARRHRPFRRHRGRPAAHLRGGGTGGRADLFRLPGRQQRRRPGRRAGVRGRAAVQRRLRCGKLCHRGSRALSGGPDGMAPPARRQCASAPTA
jgi:serine/threonine protein kinase